jgi:hypothetical protein
VEALRSALKIKADLPDARMMLGFELYKARHYKEAYDVLAQIKQVTPERAASFFLAMAFSAMEIGNKFEAKKSAELGRKYAKTAVEVAQADNIIEFVDRPIPAATQEHIVPPSIAEGSIRSEAMKAEEDLSVLRGTLQEIECLGKEARITILAASTRVSLLIRDPDRVELKNSDASTVNFTCGPQKNTRVIVEYRPKDDGQFKTSGDIATLEFTTRRPQ